MQKTKIVNLFERLCFVESYLSVARKLVYIGQHFLQLNFEQKISRNLVNTHKNRFMGQHYVVVSSTPCNMHYQLTHMCTVLSRKVVLLKQKRHTIIKFCSRLLMHRHTMGLLSNVFVVVICTCNYLPLQITLLRKDMGQYGRCGRWK